MSRENPTITYLYCNRHRAIMTTKACGARRREGNDCYGMPDYKACPEARPLTGGEQARIDGLVGQAVAVLPHPPAPTTNLHPPDAHPGDTVVLRFRVWGNQVVSLQGLGRRIDEIAKAVPGLANFNFEVIRNPKEGGEA